MRLLIFLAVMTAHLAEGYKFLVVFPIPGRSHSILGDGYVRLLVDAGHEVTYITPFPKKNTPPNLRQIDVSDLIDSFPSDIMNLETLMNKGQNPGDMKLLFNMLLKIYELAFKNDNVTKLLEDTKQNYDAVIIEWMFSELGVCFAAIYDCPFIWSTSTDPHWMITKLIDETLNPAYHPDAISTNSIPLSFKERAEELWSQISTTILKEFMLIPIEKEIYENIVGPIVAKRGQKLPPYEFMRYNASLMLGNSHISLGQSVRLPQNYKSIGGYHIDPKVEPLPENLKNLLDNSKNGLIYFSMGSNLKSKHFPVQLKTNLLQTFGKLKYTILWKFEEVLPNLPGNVHIINWAPQASILAHPNCVLFITHGGLLSTTETVHFGKPIIGIPVFADQFHNVDRATNKGFAKRVDLSYNMHEDLNIAIKEILGDPSYTKRAKELSLIYHDRPVSPGAELVHWVEHVVRTRGAPHLRSPALHMPFYQKMYLDLLAVIILVFYILTVILKRICCSGKSTVNFNKKKKL